MEELSHCQRIQALAECDVTMPTRLPIIGNTGNLAPVVAHCLIGICELCTCLPAVFIYLAAQHVEGQGRRQQIVPTTLFTKERVKLCHGAEMRKTHPDEIRQAIERSWTSGPTYIKVE